MLITFSFNYSGSISPTSSLCRWVLTVVREVEFITRDVSCVFKGESSFSRIQVVNKRLSSDCQNEIFSPWVPAELILPSVRSNTIYSLSGNSLDHSDSRTITHALDVEDLLTLSLIGNVYLDVCVVSNRDERVVRPDRVSNVSSWLNINWVFLAVDVVNNDSSISG